MKRMMGLLLALAVVVAASFAVVAQARPAGTASPAGARNQRSADVTFTKWVTSPGPDPSTAAGSAMVGVVGGDVGEGTFAGMVLRDNTTSKPGFWLGQVLYGFIGSTHSFVARNCIPKDARDPSLLAGN